MKQYGKSTISLRMEKHKTGSRGLQRHDERVPGQKHSNKNIKPERTKDNIALVRRNQSWEKSIQEIIEKEYKGKKAVRHDSVKLITTTVQMGGDFAEKATEEEKIEFMMAAYEEIKERVGEANIVSASIHLDETNVHLHAAFVPIVDGKLSAKRIVDGPASLRRLQASFLKSMQERQPHANLDRKADGQFNGIEQKLYERMTKEIKKEREEIAEVQTQLISDVWPKINQYKKDKIAFNNEKERYRAAKDKLAGQKQELDDYAKSVVDWKNNAEKHIENKQLALNQREELLNTLEDDLNEREASLEAKAKEIAEMERKTREEALRASESLSKAQELYEANEDLKNVIEGLKNENKGILERIEANKGQMSTRIKQARQSAVGLIERARNEEEREKAQETINEMYDMFEDELEHEDWNGHFDDLDMDDGLTL